MASAVEGRVYPTPLLLSRLREFRIQLTSLPHGLTNGHLFSSERWKPAADHAGFRYADFFGEAINNAVLASTVYSGTSSQMGKLPGSQHVLSGAHFCA